MERVGLISCARRKCEYAAQARDLYISPLFVKSRQYVEQHCDRCYILSAKYGLVRPDECIAPYDETLNTMSRPARKQWAARVWERLAANLQRGDEVIILAGLRYREFLVPMIEAHGCCVVMPMRGTPRWRQLQWLSERLRECADQSPGRRRGG